MDFLSLVFFFDLVSHRHVVCTLHVRTMHKKLAQAVGYVGRALSSCNWKQTPAHARCSITHEHVKAMLRMSMRVSLSDNDAFFLVFRLDWQKYRHAHQCWLTRRNRWMRVPNRLVLYSTLRTEHLAEVLREGFIAIIWWRHLVLSDREVVRALA